ncbi:MAG TPA: BamA/TamA family outer membrane protein [Kofleriaceae bacterium]|nr:BamA/TamA family outer membrane protein [Kofleriaceae bacterium]
MSTPFTPARIGRAYVAIACLIGGSAIAEPVGEDDPPPATESEPTASDVEGAPAPGDESGRVDPPASDSTVREVGRGVLFVPKLALETAFAPVRAGVWAYDHYHLRRLAIRIFFDDTETYGLYPVGQLESGYGFNVGARFVHRDLFGAREHLALHAGTGGRFRTIASAAIRSGRRLGDRFTLQLDGQFEQRPKDAFYGIGNADAIVIDGMVVPTGAEARFREQLLRTAAVADTRLVDGLHLRASGALASFTFDRSDVGAPIDELYPMQTMLGWDGIRHAYTELALRWDSRRRVNAWDSPAVRAGGWLLEGYGGRVTALDEGADYNRYGVDLQRFVRIGEGPRVVSARLFGEAVSGSIDEVPFTQLPRLGGKTLLRGYPLDRFRDRVAAMGSLEYAWDVSRLVSASAFVDAGRVYGSPSAVIDERWDDLRVGYGISLEGHTDRSFLVRTSISTSIDGGVFFDLAFDPVFDLDPRVERR